MPHCRICFEFCLCLCRYKETVLLGETRLPWTLIFDVYTKMCNKIQFWFVLDHRECHLMWIFHDLNAVFLKRYNSCPSTVCLELTASFLHDDLLFTKEMLHLQLKVPYFTKEPWSTNLLLTRLSRLKTKPLSWHHEPHISFNFWHLMWIMPLHYEELHTCTLHQVLLGWDGQDI